MQPAEPVKPLNLGREREWLIVWMVVLGFESLVAGITRSSSATDNRLFLIFATLFVKQLSTYVRHVFWELDLDHPDTLPALLQASAGTRHEQ